MAVERTPPDTPVSLRPQIDQFGSPQAQIATFLRLLDGSITDDEDDYISLDRNREIESFNSTEESMDVNSITSHATTTDDNLQCAVAAYNHICEHTMTVALELATKYKHLDIVHFCSDAPWTQNLYDIILDGTGSTDKHFTSSAEGPICSSAKPHEFLASFIAAFLLNHVMATEALDSLNLQHVHLTWDEWLENETRFEIPLNALATQLGACLRDHLCRDDQHEDEMYSIATIVEGLVREALVFGLCVRPSYGDFSWPRAGVYFDPKSMRVLEGEVPAERDVSCLLTVFPGVAVPRMDGGFQRLEAIVVLADQQGVCGE